MEPSTFDKGVSEMELSTTQEIITQLKAVKSEYELTIPRIKDMMEKNGDFISLSTLHRVFSDHAEQENFSYDRTLAPIARALLFQEHTELEQGEQETMAVRLEGLKAVLLLKNEKIDLLTDQIEKLRKQVDDLRKQYDTRLAFLRDQIELKDRRMDEKDEIIKKLLDKCL
jgi:polyhydroxyalkanoate synthesis regulator phasin